MRIFHCDHCGHLLFFENTTCVRCGRLVAYLPDLGIVGSLDENGTNTGTWRSPLDEAVGRVYRLCRNYSQEQVCNWAVADGDDNPLCVSCRLTRVIPDLAGRGPPALVSARGRESRLIARSQAQPSDRQP